MKPIKENVVIQIEVTNACHLSCANCSRLVGHHKSPFYMSLDQVRSAILSLDGFPGRIGLMGGEPALHPKFKEICEIFQELVPDRRRREFWTSGYKWEEYRSVREATFDADLVHYNDHSKPEEGWHQPLLVSIDEVVSDKQKMWKLIDNCWVQRRWSASITPKGAYFCEVAAALHHALDGPDGWSLEPGWWQKTESDYVKQKEFACLRCSAALPMDEIPNNHVPQDMVSVGNFELLKKNGSPKAKATRIQIVPRESAVRYLESVPDVVPGERGYLASHPDWRPSEFRTKIWHEPGEGSLDDKSVRSLQRGTADSDVSLPSKGVTNKIKAQIADARLIISDETLKSYSKDAPQKAELLTPIVGIEFDSVGQMLKSIDDWTDQQLTEREKDLLIKHIVDV
jgi:hypothetical protein